ncbi:MAG TPA: cytochrome c [Bradyrhizobium sp.]|nr:cytochrome c [Bradyrhizobium sp.]
MSETPGSVRRGKASRRGAVVATSWATLLLFAFPVFAQGTGPSASEPALSQGFGFVEKSGEALFTSVCQGCHMSDGKGATGAGTYPSLAGNGNLGSSGYPIGIVINGQRGMPPFGAMMNDEQVAAVVNYVRTHFGNRYEDAVTAEDVRSVRR